MKASHLIITMGALWECNAIKTSAMNGQFDSMSSKLISIGLSYTDLDYYVDHHMRVNFSAIFFNLVSIDLLEVRKSVSWDP